MQDDSPRRSTSCPTNSRDNPRRRAKGSLSPRPHTEGSVWDIKRWCLDGDFSRTWLYGEWASGRGPKRVRVGGKVKILEAPREYCERVSKEQVASDKTTPDPRSEQR